MNKIKSPSNWVAAQGNTVWLDNDARSFHAMLRGNGDGLERVYAKFGQNALRSNPSLSLEQLAQRYEAHVMPEQKNTVPELIVTKAFKWLCKLELIRIRSHC